MLWFPFGLLGLGKIIYDAVTDSPATVTPTPLSVLDLNLGRLGNQLRNRSGLKIAIIGQPGAGKSSLLSGMTGGAVEPPPVIGVQTDATNWSEDIECSLLSFFAGYVFVDVPGYDTASHPMNSFVQHFPWAEFDAFILVVSGKLHLADESMYRYAARQRKKICIARSFSENLTDSERSSVQLDMRTRLSAGDQVELVFFSNRSGEGVSDILPIFSQRYPC